MLTRIQPIDFDDAIGSDITVNAGVYHEFKQNQYPQHYSQVQIIVVILGPQRWVGC